MLDEAIALDREALQLCPPGHPSRDSSLNNLAVTLQIRFNQHGGLETLDEVIALYREALRLRSTGHPSRDSPLSNLASSLTTRFNQHGGLEVLDEAIALHREALQLRPPGHPTRDTSLINLADSLATRVNQQGGLHVLDEAIALSREALQLCPHGHSRRFLSLFATARCLLSFRSERFDFTTAAIHVSEALADNTANIWDRLDHGQRILSVIDDAYATIMYQEADPNTRAERGTAVLWLYSQATQLLPRATNFGLDASTRLQTIAGSDQLSRNGAVYAVTLGRFEEAVEILEAGRGIFWSQTMHLRAAELDSVPEKERHELRRMFGRLQSDSSIIGDATRLVEDLERAAIERRKLNEEAEALITKIRTYPGLERFLLPPAFNSLLVSLPAGFVVILNSSRLGCHALLLNGATGVAKSLVVAAARGFNGMRATNYSDDKPLENTLRRLWVSLVRPVLVGLGLEVRLPRF
jgi:tetratricopeptide (TPR) repeat protein